MRRLLGTVRGVAVFDWDQLTLRAALRLTPALVIVLALGLWLGEPRAGAVAAGGALVVGFGTFQQFTRSRAGPMIFAWIGTGAAACIGTLAGNYDTSMALAALAFGFGCGLLPAIGMGAYWVGQQCGIFFFVAGAFAGDAEHALARAALVMGGGLVQFACYGVAVTLERRALPWQSLRRIAADGASALSGLSFHLRLGSPWLGFALRAALALAAAVVVERRLDIPNSYWVAVTALLLMRPDFHDSLGRSVGRVAGTIGGAALATIIAHVLDPGPPVLAVLVAGFAFLGFATLRLNYGVFALFITGYVVFLLVLAGLAERQVASARIVATAVGAGFALAVHLHVWLRRAQAT